MRNMLLTDREKFDDLARGRFLYDRPGHNRWPITLDTSGRVEEGGGPDQFFWWCEQGRLLLVGIDGKPKTILSPIGDRWLGESTSPRLTRVHLTPLAIQT